MKFTEMLLKQPTHQHLIIYGIVYQPLELINKYIKEKTILENQVLLDIINHVKKNQSNMHLFGLLSDGGIHSHINHLIGILDMLKKEEIENVFIHIFTDGRDTLPNVAKNYIDILEQKLSEIGIGSVATISGRYYAMDRENKRNWCRKNSYNCRQILYDG